MSLRGFLAALLAVALLAPGPAVAASAPRAEAARTEKINLNTASVKELMTLQGIGRGLAERIVKHREQHGQFKTLDDLRKVDGVPGGVLEKNRERLVVK